MTDKDYTWTPTLSAEFVKELAVVAELELLDQYPALRVLLVKQKLPASKSQLLRGYRQYLEQFGEKPNALVLSLLTKRPVRTMSGVAPVTVLTKPYPCPGQCIFCPSDVRMPKSYLADEPGAQRAERNWFDPYLQTYNRLQALREIGHDVQKAELIVLGGTWSYYLPAYQRWFTHECFRALNDFADGTDDRSRIESIYSSMSQQLLAKGEKSLTNNPVVNASALDSTQVELDNNQQLTYNQVVSKLYVAPEKLLGLDTWQTATWIELEREQQQNETAGIRCVGLVMETRPDSISPQEVMTLRRLGCTKTQIGVQSLQDNVLAMNKRGHDVAATALAFALLRQAGFKIHAHWMCNLYGSSVAADKREYLKLFADPQFRPDELKIYPCSLLESAQLLKNYQDGSWQPYSSAQLDEVVSFALTHTPPYCRLTRVIRDIPSTYIVDGNKRTNLRQILEQRLLQRGEVMRDIRSREVRSLVVTLDELRLVTRRYTTSTSTELFLEWSLKTIGRTVSADPTDRLPVSLTRSPSPKIAGFLRLSLPKEPSFIEELGGSAIIREVHVYGQLTPVGRRGSERTQHMGLGSSLIEKAKQIAKKRGFTRLSVISAVGTREYYRQRGFVDGELYQHCDLS